METHIQYARTSDGVSIAYAVVGAGPPFVMASQIWGSLHMAQSGIGMVGFWSAEELQGLGRKVVVHDARGTGLSDGGPIDYSLSARARDLEAVVRATGVERFPLYGAGHGAATAIAFAVDHPVLVEQLIIVNPFILGAEYYDTNPAMRQLRATESIMAGDWEYFTRSLASGVSGFDDAEKVQQLAKAFQSGMRPTDVVAFRDAAEFIDLGDLTERINIPTLVVRDDTMLGSMLARNVAARISGAQFVVGDHKRAVREALHLSPDRTAPENLSVRSGTVFRTILFTDLVDHTLMMQRLGDDAGRAVLHEHERITRDVLSRHGGTEVKTDGDSFMASFTSATNALECAVALQRAFASHSASAAEPIQIRAGLNVGEPIEESGDYFGSAVILAARIKDQANAGEILVPEAVRHLLSGKAISYTDRGDVQLKGFEDAVRLYEVRWQE